MNNKILLSGIASVLLVTTSLNATSLDEKIKKLEDTIKAQQAQIEELISTSEDVEDIDERLEIVETRSFTDKIKLGLGMRVEMNNYSNTYAGKDDNGKDSYDANEIYRTKLNINMKSKISDDLKFTGRLSMYKNWGDSTTRNVNYDSMQGRKPDGSALYVERAYLDWVMNPTSEIPMILTLGRQPSSDGPSYQIKENMTRKGTYDALAADGAADGIVVTANLNKVLSGTTFRVAYGTPNVLDNEAYSNEQMNYNGNDSSDYKSTKVTGLFLEHTHNAFSFGNLFQAYYMDAKDMNANPQLLDINQTSQTFMQSTDENVGDLSIAGFMLEANKIGGNLDLFAHYAKSTAKPNGQTVDLDGANSGNGQDTIGLLTSTAGDTSTKTGQAIWLGARYAIGKSYKIGAEYNKGSQNWFSFTSGANDPLNKLATRGDAVELYVTRVINKNANIRLGYVDINYNYTGSGSHLGTPVAITSALGNGAIKETKNTYITFNVLF